MIRKVGTSTTCGIFEVIDVLVCIIEGGLELGVLLFKRGETGGYLAQRGGIFIFIIDKFTRRNTSEGDRKHKK